MNKVFLIGNLTRDPELSETANGTTICRFGIAVNRRTPSGEQTDFYNLTAFRSLADTIARYKKKGDRVAVVGDIQLRQYEGNDGIKRTAVDVIVQDIEFLNSGRNANGGDDFYDAPAAAPSHGDAPARKKPALQSFDDDGDIPF